MASFSAQIEGHAQGILVADQKVSEVSGDEHRYVVRGWSLANPEHEDGRLKRFVDTLQGLGVQFRSLTDGIDTGCAAGRFFFLVMAALAEMERDLI